MSLIYLLIAAIMLFSAYKIDKIRWFNYLGLLFLCYLAWKSL